jgi:glutathione S-transferase
VEGRSVNWLAQLAVSHDKGAIELTWGFTMSLTLYFHPLSSFCHKVLMALYENRTVFRGEVVQLGEPESRAAFLKVWPIGKFPVLRDDARGAIVPESTIIIEFLQQHYPGAVKFIPAEPDQALQARLWDRVIDLHLHMQMQKVVSGRLRPKGEEDFFGIEQAKATMKTTLDQLETQLGESWLIGDVFSLADCAAAPALFYAQAVMPFAESHPKVAAYFERLAARPSFQRLIGEAGPLLKYFPFYDDLPQRYRVEG